MCKRLFLKVPLRPPAWLRTVCQSHLRRLISKPGGVLNVLVSTAQGLLYVVPITSFACHRMTGSNNNDINKLISQFIRCHHAPGVPSQRSNIML